MARSTEKGERLTTVVCTLVAIAILAAGVTARQGDTPASDEPAQWESDVRYQLKAAFRHNARERDARLAQVAAVMAAWKASTQSDSDREMLIDWLSDTAVRSMPGSVTELPPSPEFSSRESTQVVQSQPVQLPQYQPIAIQAPPLLTDAAIPDLQVTPTPYDPFAVDSETHTAVENTENESVNRRQPIASDVVDTLVLEQPPTVVPAQRHRVNKHTIEMAASPAPLPESSFVSLETSQASSGAELPTLAVAPSFQEPVGVNLTELAARIAGYHDSLDEVETALLRSDAASLALVAEQAKHLDAMTRDYRFVQLYYDALTEEEKQTVLAPRPLSATLREVSRQLDRYEESLDTDFLGSIDASQSAQIEELRELLSTLSARVRQ